MAFLNTQDGSLSVEDYLKLGVQILVAFAVGGLVNGLIVWLFTALFTMAGVATASTAVQLVAVIIGLAVHLVVNGWAAYKLFGFRPMG